MRSIISSIVLSIAVTFLADPWFSLTAAEPAFQPTWPSVTKHNAAPEWFKDAKFGIWWCWGAFTTPEFGWEWYPHSMFVKNKNDGRSYGVYDFHLKNFGDPIREWPYQKFIDGGRDKNGRWIQFAPKLKSAGGNFDPEAMAQLFVDAGAKYAGPIAEHHDGYSLWRSKVNEWNSYDRGPKLDVVGDLGKAIRAKGLKFLVSMHHVHPNPNGYHDVFPRQTDPSLKKLYGQLSHAEENQLWLDKMKEVIDGYKPDIMYHDGGVNTIDEPIRLKYLSHYYNVAIQQGQEVVVTFKNGAGGGFNLKSEVNDYEIGGPEKLLHPYWQSDNTLAWTEHGVTWGYVQGIRYWPTQTILHTLIDLVSKNGNMLLTICPRADGSIPPEQKAILLEMGDWLHRFGESIYATRAWKVNGEGPTRIGNYGGIPTSGTPRDVRFTQSKDGKSLYAIVLGWPGDGTKLTITSLNTGNLPSERIKKVELLGKTAGAYINLKYAQNGENMTVNMPPKTPHEAMAYVIKLTLTTPDSK